MERIEIEVLTDVSNLAIVRMPGRNYPGCVFQGDSVSHLLKCVQHAYSLARETTNTELIDELAELKELLEDRLKHYEKVITQHGYSIPYASSITG